MEQVLWKALSCLWSLPISLILLSGCHAHSWLHKVVEPDDLESVSQKTHALTQEQNNIINSSDWYHQYHTQSSFITNPNVDTIHHRLQHVTIGCSTSPKP